MVRRLQRCAVAPLWLGVFGRVHPGGVRTLDGEARRDPLGGMSAAGSDVSRGDGGSDALYVSDGRLLDLWGVTTGIDMSLAMVEKDVGAAVANIIARRMVLTPAARVRSRSLVRCCALRCGRSFVCQPYRLDVAASGGADLMCRCSPNAGCRAQLLPPLRHRHRPDRPTSRRVAASGRGAGRFAVTRRPRSRRLQRRSAVSRRAPEHRSRAPVRYDSTLYRRMHKFAKES